MKSFFNLNLQNLSYERRGNKYSCCLVHKFYEIEIKISLYWTNNFSRYMLGLIIVFVKKHRAASINGWKNISFRLKCYYCHITISPCTEYLSCFYKNSSKKNLFHENFFISPEITEIFQMDMVIGSLCVFSYLYMFYKTSRNWNRTWH